VFGSVKRIVTETFGGLGDILSGDFKKGLSRIANSHPLNPKFLMEEGLKAGKAFNSTFNKELADDEAKKKAIKNSSTQVTKTKGIAEKTQEKSYKDFMPGMFSNTPLIFAPSKKQKTKKIQGNLPEQKEDVMSEQQKNDMNLAVTGGKKTLTQTITFGNIVGEMNNIVETKEDLENLSDKIIDALLRKLHGTSKVAF
jgi:hypothetical protein